jgi:hypothetical protein
MTPLGVDGFAIESATGLTIGPQMCLESQGREEIASSNLVGRGVTLIAGGQSNCSNTADGAYVPASPHLYNLNIGDGRLYRAREPLLGCDMAKPGASSNFLTRLGDDILRAGRADYVVLVPSAISGVPAAYWSERGRFHRNVAVTASRVREAGLLLRTRCICMWQHGETDCYLATPAHEYTRDVVSVANALQRGLGPVPFITALASTYQFVMSPVIRMGQVAIADRAANRFVGPDTDGIDWTLRHEGDWTHWNAEGAAAAAVAWLETLIPFLND